ncbi:hypothetical protein LG047_06645 [Methylocystis sp. WRRC1]|uniref:hypothetical protein n=1 Tax=Methylocystis sp. WRRC1 TaxID=1732014 RepID=UPI001D14A736|nr:hypothetical protein [Methylocystis sp. WRRC1]MCC3245002.1 hypothetical protein [Methylocystis sp. WRRC1]
MTPFLYQNAKLAAQRKVVARRFHEAAQPLADGTNVEIGELSSINLIRAPGDRASFFGVTP